MTLFRPGPHSLHVPYVGPSDSPEYFDKFTPPVTCISNPALALDLHISLKVIPKNGNN